LRWRLLRNYGSLSATNRAEIDYLLDILTTRRNAREWVYREQLRENLERKQIKVVTAML